MAGRAQIAVVGAGPAGIAAAIFLQRGGFDPLLLEKGTPGGLLRQADIVENYPGFPGGVKGPELADLLFEHFRAVGGVVTRSDVKAVERKGEGFLMSSSEGEFFSDAIIIATGTRPKMVALRGLEADLEKRVHYDLRDLLVVANADEPIVVYGGGDAAFDQAMNLRRRGHNVTVLCRSESRCLPLLNVRARENGVAVLEESPIQEVGRGRRGLRLTMNGGATIDASHLLIACGREPCLEMFDRSPRAQIREDELPCTGIEGLFLAGDVAAGSKRQVGIAVGSGISAAMSAERYLREVSSE